MLSLSGTAKTISPRDPPGADLGQTLLSLSARPVTTFVRSSSCVRLDADGFFIRMAKNDGDMVSLVWQNLPLELLPRIVEALSPDDRATLRALALSSSLLRVSAQRVLFDSCEPYSTYSTWQTADEAFPEQEIKLLDVLIASPDRLALYVRYYKHFFSQFRPRHVRVREQVGRALKLMVNLKGLWIWGHDSGSMAALLHGCSFQLIEFGWDGVKDDEFMMQQFLPAQPAIDHLRLGCSRDGKGLIELMESNKMLLPNLITLAGKVNVIDAFLPGRKVQHLCWKSSAFSVDGPAWQEVSTGVAEALGYVETLICGTFYHRPPLSLIVKRLRSLRLLKLLRWNPEESILLGRLPCLQVLIVDTIEEDDPSDFFPVKSVEDEVSLAGAVFLHAKNLWYIDIQRPHAGYTRYRPPVANELVYSSKTVTLDQVNEWKNEKGMGSFILQESY